MRLWWLWFHSHHGQIFTAMGLLRPSVNSHDSHMAVMAEATGTTAAWL